MSSRYNATGRDPMKGNKINPEYGAKGTLSGETGRDPMKGNVFDPPHGAKGTLFGETGRDPMKGNVFNSIGNEGSSFNDTKIIYPTPPTR
jgi:hypothetical protein